VSCVTLELSFDVTGIGCPAACVVLAWASKANEATNSDACFMLLLLKLNDCGS
jgi:hypothetical protein